MAGGGWKIAGLRNEPNSAQGAPGGGFAAEFSWIGFTAGRQSWSRSGFPPVTANLPETAILPRAGLPRNSAAASACFEMRALRAPQQRGVFKFQGPDKSRLPACPEQRRREEPRVAGRLEGGGRMGAGRRWLRRPAKSLRPSRPRIGWRWLEFRRITKRTQSCAKRGTAPVSRRIFLDWLYPQPAKVEQEQVSAGDSKSSPNGDHSAGRVVEE